MFTEKKLVSLNNEFIALFDKTYKTLVKVEKILKENDKLTEGQLMYLTDARSRLDVATNIIGSLQASENDFIDHFRFNPEYDPRSTF